MSEANRKACGEGLSLSLQDRDARVVGKSVSKSDYGAVRIGNVGSRIEERVAKAETRYQHFFPKFITRFFGAPSRSLWSSSYPSPDLQYLLWNPYQNDDVVEEQSKEQPSAWTKAKRKWTGAKVFRMPKRKPMAPTLAVRTPKTQRALAQRALAETQEQTEESKVLPLQRLRQKNAEFAFEESSMGRALASLPPFMSSSKSVHKVLRDSQTTSSNRFRPESIGVQFLPQTIQNQIGESKPGVAQAEGRFRRTNPTGLRSLQVSSPMMQELMPVFKEVEERHEDVAPVVSPWFSREPKTSTNISTNKIQNQVSSMKALGQKEEQTIFSQTSGATDTKQRSVISALSRSFRRSVAKNNRPSQRVAQNIDLGMRGDIHETPATVHAMQRAGLVMDQNHRSVLPVSNVFSEQSKIGKSIARHQESFLSEKELQIGSQVSAKAQRDLSAQKRNEVRRPQLFSVPDLLGLQTPTVQANPTESVQEKAASPWFSRNPAQSVRTRVVQKQSPNIRPSKEGQVSSIASVIQRSKAGHVSSGHVPAFAERQSRSEDTISSYVDQRFDKAQDLDVFGFGSVPTNPARSSLVEYAANRMVEEEGLRPKITPNSQTSGYQTLDQRAEERVALRMKEGEDRVARLDAPMPHQIRERGFVPEPDFVNIQEAKNTEHTMEEQVQAKESPWFTRSPVVHASKRDSAVSQNGSIVPKAVASIGSRSIMNAIQKRAEQSTMQGSQETSTMHLSRPLESALDRNPQPSTHNPSRPKIVRDTRTDEVSLLRSVGLDDRGIALALAYAQGDTKPLSSVEKAGESMQGWADVRFRRQSPVSYAKGSQPNTVVVQTPAEATQQTEAHVQETQSPWFTREPSSSSARSSAIQGKRDSTNVHASGGSLSHMMARSEAEISLPQERVIGTKSRSIFSEQPVMRLSTMPPQSVLAQNTYKEETAAPIESNPGRDSATWLSPKEVNQENRTSNEFIKRVAKLGVKAKIYKSPKGVMMDAKVAKDLGFAPPSGKSRIPLTWILEAVENKSSSGILPNWAQRASEQPLHKGTADMVNSLNKASSMDEVLRIIFERSSSQQVAPSFQSIPVHATQVLQHIRQEAHQVAMEQEQFQEMIAQAQQPNSASRTSSQVLTNFTGLKPIATAQVAAAAPQEDKLSKLTKKLQDLILVAEQQGKREAQGGARLAEDSAQAIEEGRGEPKGIDESVSEELNLDQLYQDVLRSVEDAINLKRVLRFDNDDHFDGGW